MQQHTYRGEDIKPLLVKSLTAAHTSIHLSTGWFVDKSLLRLLEKKAMDGVSIKMILLRDADNQAQADDYQELVRQGIQIIWLDEAERETVIDHKFVVIDEEQTITGNYNWGHRNPPPEEHITITKYIPTLAQGYIEEFDYLAILPELPKNAEKPANNIAELLKRMEVLKVLLSIGDTAFIHMRLDRIADFQQDINVSEIYLAILNKEFDRALELLSAFIELHQSLLQCIEPPVENLRREIQKLEEDIALTSQEFSETQKVIQEFSKLHSEALGDILQRILLQNKIKAEIEARLDAENAEKQEEFAEAEKDHEEYSRSYEASKKETFQSLNKEEKKALKKLYRQASLQCHPDRIVEDLKEEAERFFVELNQAYKANDLEKVKEIHTQLKEGVMLRKSEAITELKKLKSTIKSLQQTLENWQQKLAELRAMPTYQTINHIEDWEEYFTETKAVLQERLERLEAYNQEYMEEEQGKKVEEEVTNETGHIGN